MTAVLESVRTDAFDVAPFDEVAVSELALADLFCRCERLHQSNIQHEAANCLVCFERR